VLLDIQGPKIRTGSFKEGSILLKQGQEYELTTDESVKLSGDEKRFYVDYKVGGRKGPSRGRTDYKHEAPHTSIPSCFHTSLQPLFTSTKKGDPVLIDDGNVVLEVVGHREDGQGVLCRALNSGKIKNRRGVNVPKSKVPPPLSPSLPSSLPPSLPPSSSPTPPIFLSQVDLPALTTKDKADLSFGIQNDVDFVAASFVRKAQDILDIRAYVKEEMSKFWPATHLVPKIIAKVESTEAIQNYEEIMLAADGIMVARGDLGVRREGGREGRKEGGRDKGPSRKRGCVRGSTQTRWLSRAGFARSNGLPPSSYASESTFTSPPFPFCPPSLPPRWRLTKPM
jgi:pyruvate kinase